MSIARRSIIIAMALLGASTPLPARQSPPTFRSGTEGVVVPAAVTDGNRAVHGLTAADFELTDNGVVQTITSAAIESVPIDVTLVLDVSGSVEGVALAQFVADVQTIAESLKPNDRVRLVTFSSVVRDALGQEAGGARLPIDHVAGGGGTSFYNALTSALLTTAGSERPQLVFAFSDGRDTTSFIDADAVATVAKASASALYLTLAGPIGNRLETSVTVLAPAMAPYDGGPDVNVLRDAAEKSGGALYTKSIGASMAATFQQAYGDFRTSYVLTYTPAGVTRAGWHDLAVRVKEHRYNIRARQGYDSGN